MTLIPPVLRDAVFARAGGRCEYCQLDQRSQVATFPVDHVVPRSRGGTLAIENLALACPRCNALKWTHVTSSDPDDGTLVTIYNPRTDVWNGHFRWSIGDPAVIEALTAKARATIALLELNGPTRLAIRRWLMQLGMHPPA